MTDVVDSLGVEDRKRTMTQVKSQNTKPEMVLRRMLYSMGYRYRLHDKMLPGKPDIVFRGRRKVIFVNGCFWHQHQHCKAAARPASNAEYWNKKLERNIDRDRRNVAELENFGWQVLIVWECEIRSPELVKAINVFLAEDSLS